jgi:hypothetical protein
MSKIDVYNKIKSENTKSIENLHLSLQRNSKGELDPHNDKGCFRFYDRQIWDTDMKFFIHSCYGYYGSSSAYSIGNPIIKKYILEILNKNSKEIVEETIKRMEEDIEKARLDCIEEAKQILESV